MKINSGATNQPAVFDNGNINSAANLFSQNKKLAPEEAKALEQMLKKVMTPGKVAIGVYSDGQNDLERIERKIFKEIQDEQLKGKSIDAFVFYSSRTGAQLAYIRDGKFLKLENLGLPYQEPPNMSKPEVLAGFVSMFLMANSKSPIKVLDLSNHGNAALGAFYNDIFSDKTSMGVDGIGEGIKMGVKRYKELTGKDAHIDLVIFDQCLMGCAEATHALIKTGVVKYAVSSPEVTFGLGNPALIASILADRGMDDIDKFEEETAQMITNSIINYQSPEGFKRASSGILVRCMPKDKIKALTASPDARGQKPLIIMKEEPQDLVLPEKPNVPYTPEDFKEPEDKVVTAVKEFVDEVKKSISEFGNDGAPLLKLFPDGISTKDKNLYAYHLLADTIFGVKGMGRFMDLIYGQSLPVEEKEILEKFARSLCKLEKGEELPKSWPENLEYPFKPAIPLFETYAKDNNLPKSIREKAKKVAEAFKERLVSSSINPTYLGKNYSDCIGETIAIPYSPFYVNLGEGGILWTAFAQQVMLKSLLEKIGAMPPKESALYIENEKTGKTSRIDPNKLSLS